MSFTKSRKNPFDKTALNAKIPDGKATVSNAVRVQTIAEFTCATNAKLYGVFFAGLRTPLLMKGVETGSPVAANFDNSPRFDSSTDPFTWKTDQLEKWRTVSSALRFQMVNNADENDGWFEAIRINPQVKADFFRLCALSNAAGKEGNIELKTPGALPWIPAQDTDVWANHPTYVTGKIRDFHQYMWKLNSVNSDHDFSPVSSTSGLENFAACAVDTSYDIICFRVHPRTTAPNTKLVAHVVSNQEMIFNTKTLSASFATACPSKKNRTMRDNVAPALAARYKSVFGYAGRTFGGPMYYSPYARRSYASRATAYRRRRFSALKSKASGKRSAMRYRTVSTGRRVARRTGSPMMGVTRTATPRRLEYV